MIWRGGLAAILGFLAWLAWGFAAAALFEVGLLVGLAMALVEVEVIKEDDDDDHDR